MFKIMRYGKVASTQDMAKKSLKHGLVITADAQTRGKGRFKRHWHSGKGGLWLSIIMKLKNTEKIPYLTFIAALAANKAVKDICGLKTEIKWPNDLLYKKKKVAGILTETILGKENYAVIGIGINVNNKIPKNIVKIAISLKDIIKNEIYKEDLLELLVAEFEKFYMLYQKNEFGMIRKLWEDASCMMNRKVKIKTIGRTYSGISKGIDDEGGLIVKVKDKSIKILEGDVFLL